MSKESVRVGRIRRSIILIAGQSRDTGLYELDSCGSFLGFKRGIITEVFQMSGIILEATERLNIFVRYSTPFGPRCFKCRLEMLSGPAALEALQVLIASAVCLGVKEMGFSRLFFLIFFVIFLDVLELSCLMIEEYCLLKLFAISSDDVK